MKGGDIIHIFKNVLIIGPCLDQISPVVSQEKICLYFTDHDDRLHMMVKAHMALAGVLKQITIHSRT